MITRLLENLRAATPDEELTHCVELPYEFIIDLRSQILHVTEHSRVVILSGLKISQYEFLSALIIVYVALVGI